MMNTDPYNTAEVKVLDVLDWEEPSIEDTQPIRIALFVNRVSEDSQGVRCDKSRVFENTHN